MYRGYWCTITLLTLGLSLILLVRSHDQRQVPLPGIAAVGSTHTTTLRASEARKLLQQYEVPPCPEGCEPYISPLDPTRLVCPCIGPPPPPPSPPPSPPPPPPSGPPNPPPPPRPAQAARRRRPGSPRMRTPSSMPPSEQPADGMGISPVTPSSSTPLELINPGPLLASQLAAMAAMAALENPSQELVVEAPNPQLAAEAPSPESSP